MPYSLSEWLSLAAALLLIGFELRPLFRRPRYLTVTNLSTGRSVTIDTHAGYEEGRKLFSLPPPAPGEPGQPE